MRVFVLSLAACALLAGAAMAGDCCSQPTCCDDGCQKMTCKVVCVMKKVKKTVWVVECEPICIANPTCKRSCCNKRSCCSNGCEATNGCGCGTCDPCAELLARPMVKPKCRMICRKKLVKKTIICEVPTYKCITVPCGSCCGCNENGSAAPAKEEKSAINPAPMPPRSMRLTQAR